MKKQITKKLYSQLCEFGLDSKEWLIRPISDRLYVIRHHQDPQYQFLGQVIHQRWADIWLVSI